MPENMSPYFILEDVKHYLKYIYDIDYIITTETQPLLIVVE